MLRGGRRRFDRTSTLDALMCLGVGTRREIAIKSSAKTATKLRALGYDEDADELEDLRPCPILVRIRFRVTGWRMMRGNPGAEPCPSTALMDRGQLLDKESFDDWEAEEPSDEEDPEPHPLARIAVMVAMSPRAKASTHLRRHSPQNVSSTPHRWAGDP